MQAEMIVLTIQNRRYGMRKMPPMQGARFGIRVGSLISKIAAGKDALKSLELLQTFIPKEGDNAVEKPKEFSLAASEAISIGSSILGLLSNIDPNELMEIFKEAFSYEVYCGDIKLSDEISFDVHFQSYPGDLYVVALWATYNHVKDFFTGLGDGMKALMPSSGQKKA